MSQVLIDGRPRRTIDYRDRGFSYGDGLFETMRIRRRAVRLLDYHLERLQEGCRRLEIASPSRKILLREINRRAQTRAEAILKLIVTRGVGERGYRPTGRERCTRVISLHALPQGLPPAAVGVRVCATPLSENPALAGLKTLNRLEFVLARSEWRDPRIWEGLMCDLQGNVVCGTMSNLFLRRGRLLMTPLLDRCGTAGTMRRWVMEQAASLRLRTVECRLRFADLVAVEEAFLTNAVAGIVSVSVVRRGALRAAKNNRDVADQLRARLELV
jgi:4-amino-4-deoxychorismate lyase